MADTKIRGITIQLGADTTGISTALGSLNSTINKTSSQLKDINKLLKLDPTNTNLLTQKQQALKKAVSDSKEKVQALKDAQKALGDRTEENARQYDALEREIVSCTSEQKNWQKELDTFGSVGAQQIAAVGEKLKDVGSKLSDIGGKLTTSLTVPIAGAFTLAATEASDMEENLNKVEVAFGENADSVKAWADTATQQFGLSKNAALEATSLFGDMGTSMGLTTDEAADMSTSLAGLAGDLSSFKNVDIETAMNALKGVFTGETESLKSLGVIMNETNLEEFADGLGLVYDEMSQAEKVSLRYEYVLSKTENAQGDYARTSDGAANSIRTLKATVSNLAASIGEQLLPIVTPIVQKVTEWVQKFSELDGGTKKLIVQVGLAVAALGPVLMIIGKIASGVGSLLTLVPLLISPIGLVGAAIAALVAGGVLLIKNWDKVEDTARTLYRNVATAFNNLKSNVVSAVNTLKTNVINLFSGIWTGIKNVFSTLVSWFKSIFGSASDGVKSSFGTVVSFFSGIWSGIKSVFSGVSDFFSGAFSDASSAIESAFSGVSSFFSSVWASVTSGLDTIDYRISQSAANAQSLASATSSYSTAYSTTGNGSISYYAKGGLLSSGFGIVGENGPELVQMTNAGAMITPLTNSTNNSFSVNVNASFNGGYSTKNARQLARAINKELGQMYG